VDQFCASLENPTPPAGLNPLLEALWWDARGNWDRAHEIAQADDQSLESAWVHAYLHRKEGDNSNAGYWYRRARQPVAKGTLAEEWREIAGALLDRLNTA
jgi:hypothetical protein